MCCTMHLVWPVLLVTTSQVECWGWAARVVYLHHGCSSIHGWEERPPCGRAPGPA